MRDVIWYSLINHVAAFSLVSKLWRRVRWTLVNGDILFGLINLKINLLSSLLLFELVSRLRGLLFKFNHFICNGEGASMDGKANSHAGKSRSGDARYFTSKLFLLMLLEWLVNSEVLVGISSLTGFNFNLWHSRHILRSTREFLLVRFNTTLACKVSHQYGIYLRWLLVWNV